MYFVYFTYLFIYLFISYILLLIISGMGVPLEQMGGVCGPLLKTWTKTKTCDFSKPEQLVPRSFTTTFHHEDSTAGVRSSYLLTSNK